MGFEPTISAGERPQTYVLDCAATGAGLIPIAVKKLARGSCKTVDLSVNLTLQSSLDTFPAEVAINGFGSIRT
jgi:hypothetical protein